MKIKDCLYCNKKHDAGLACPEYIDRANSNWNLIVPWWKAEYGWWAKYNHWCHATFLVAIDHWVRGGKIKLARL